MEEIKFRAWDKRTKKLVLIDDLYWFEENGVHENGDCGWSIEQYTGLKDKNGKDEAYENDQFRTEINMSPDGISSAHNISFWIPVICTIVFRNGSFVGKYEVVSHSEGKYNFTNRTGYVRIPTEIEIIGNIHEENKIG